jgi:hypothetical protein
VRTFVHQTEYDACLDGIPDDHGVQAAIRGLQGIIAVDPTVFEEIPGYGDKRLAVADPNMLGGARLRLWYSIRDATSIYLWGIDYAEVP